MIKHFNCCNSNIRKRDFDIIFYVVENNQDLKLGDLIKKIGESLKEDCNLGDIEKFLSFMIRYTYPTRGKFIKEVLDCKKSGIDKKIVAPSARRIENMEDNMVGPSAFVEDERTKETIKMMKEYIEAKKTGKPIERDANDYYKVRKDLSRIDLDLAVDYFIAVNNLEPISLEEIDQIKYTLDFFIENTVKNYEMFEKLDYKNKDDESKIRSFYIEGEKELDPVYDKNIGKLYAWKLGKLREALTNYKILSENFNKVSEKQDFCKFDSLATSRRKNLNEDVPFLVEYYDQLNNIGRTYDGIIKKIHTITDDKRKELEKRFVKKLLHEKKDL